MPQRKTAKKDLKKNAKRRQRNLRVKRQMQITIKKLKKSIAANDSNNIAQALKETYKVLDKAATKNVINYKKADRKKSRLTKLAKVKPGTQTTT